MPESSGIDVVEEDPNQLELVAGWARTPGDGPVREDSLPAAAALALASFRAAHHGVATLLASRTTVDSAETSRYGPVAACPSDDELVVLSVVTSEVSVYSVQVVAHSLLLHVVTD